MNSSRKKILVALDGSDQSLDAVRYLKNVLPPENVKMVLFHVMRKISQSFWDMGINPMGRDRMANIAAWEIEQKRAMEDFMEHASNILFEAGFSREAVKTNLHVRVEGIARDIIIESQAGYDSVIVGRKGLSKIKDLVIGSIADKLVHKLSNIPVCIVGGKPLPGKILIAMDTSEGALKAVDHAGLMFGNADIEITLMHAIRGISDLQIQQESILQPDMEDELVKDIIREMNPAFEKAKNRLVNAGLNPQRITSKVVSGVSSRALAIYEEAKKEGIGTIIIGRRGLSKVQEFFIGRVGNKVIQMAREMAVWVVS